MFLCFLFDALLLLLYIYIFAFNVRLFLFTNNRFYSIFDRLFSMFSIHGFSFEFEFFIWHIYVQWLLISILYSVIYIQHVHVSFDRFYAFSSYVFSLLIFIYIYIYIYMSNALSCHLYVVSLIFDGTHFNEHCILMGSMYISFVTRNFIRHECGRCDYSRAPKDTPRTPSLCVLNIFHLKRKDNFV